MSGLASLSAGESCSLLTKNTFLPSSTMPPATGPASTFALPQPEAAHDGSPAETSVVLFVTRSRT